MKLSRIATFSALSLLLTAGAMNASSIYYLGAEDVAGSHGYENTGDFNDMIVKIVSNDLSVNSTTGVWKTMVQPNEDGSPFWDQKSLDGSKYNIGYCLLDQQNCTNLGTAIQGLNYYGTASGGSVNSFTFAGSGDISTNLLIEVSDLSNVNSFGYYRTNAPGTLIQLYSGHADPGASASFSLNPGTGIGFYLKNGENVFRTDAALNVGDSTSQNHFALFSSTTPEVPEPSTFAMLFGGLAAVAFGRKRKLN